MLFQKFNTMSIQYDKVIFSSTNHTLKVNFSGIKDSEVSMSDLKMSIYAFNNTGQPIFSETLNFEEIKSLFEHLSQISIIKYSTKITSGKFIETTGEVIDILNKLNNVDSSILKIVLNKLKEEDKIKNLFASLAEDDEKGNNPLDILSGLQKQRGWKAEIENLELLLQLEETGNIVEEIKKYEKLKSYFAGQPEKIFQKWIENNIKWIFGVEYIKKHDFKTTGLYSQGDILMESMDGFLDFIELKRPEFEIFKFDNSHNCYYPSPDLSKVIGQCFYYLQEMEDVKLKLEKEHKVKILRPRVKIICGRTKGFDQDDKRYNALRMLNCSLNHIEVITFDYLLSCGYKMIENYK